MSVLAWVVVGLLAGWLAGQIVRGQSHGRSGDVVVGVLGAILGGWLASAVLGLDVTGVNPTSALVAVMGAVALIVILRAIPDAQLFE